MSAANNISLGVIVLAAGASSRMGQPKLLLPWRGTTVIGHLLSQWQELGAAQIAVVVRANDATLGAELERLSFSQADRIENPQPERGMFSSIVCAANWQGWRANLSRWAIVLGDQPHLHLEMLKQLLKFSVQHPNAICQPVSGGHTRHPVILSRPALTALERSSATTLKDFLKLTTLPRVQFEVNDSSLSLDMDTPEDYKRLTAFQ